MTETLKRLQAFPLLPVTTLSDPAAAPVVTRVLADAGFAAIEIVLRTDNALDALAAAAAADCGLLVGAGTVTSVERLEQAHAAGACFAISPGFSPALAVRAQQLGVAWIPGVATAGEVQNGLAAGLSFFKFFPAASAGGPGWLRAMAPVFPTVHFCPTGGVKPENLADYLALNNVPVAGGSWFLNEADRAGRDPGPLQKAARAAAALAKNAQ